MTKTDLVYISDILSSIELIKSYLANKSLVDFVNNIGLQDQVIRRLEVIGIAANKISSAIKSNYNQIPWREIVDTRNRIAHDYDAIDLEIVWDIYELDFPNLEPQLKSLLHDLESKPQ